MERDLVDHELAVIRIGRCYNKIGPIESFGLGFEGKLEKIFLKSFGLRLRISRQNEVSYGLGFEAPQMMDVSGMPGNVGGGQTVFVDHSETADRTFGQIDGQARTDAARSHYYYEFAGELHGIDNTLCTRCELALIGYGFDVLKYHLVFPDAEIDIAVFPKGRSRLPQVRTLFQTQDLAKVFFRKQPAI
jgi:hypothetical protein